MEVNMAASEPEDIEARFSRLTSVGGSTGETIIGKLKSLAHEFNELASHASPAFLSIIQRLEQAAHVASSAPILQETAPDPSPAASTSPTDAASGEESGSSTASSSATSPAGPSATTDAPSSSSPEASSESSSAAPKTESKG